MQSMQSIKSIAKTDCQYRFVDGPINYVRLEGYNKTIYIFMDIHEGEDVETECNDISSVNFKRYMFEQLLNTDVNKKYDFFMEMNPVDMLTKEKNKGNYIQQICTFMVKAFDINNGFLNYKSNKFPNLYLHIVDLRQDVLNIESMFLLMSTLKYIGIIINKVGMHILPEHLNSLSSILNRYREETNKVFDNVQTLYDVLFNSKHHPSKYIMYLKNTIIDNKDKIDTSIHNKIKQYIDNYIKKDMEHFLGEYKIQFNKDVESSLGILNMPNNGMLVITLLTTKLISFQIMFLQNIASRIMDMYQLYMLFRKDVTNAIIYTGVAHGIFDIYFLIKYLDFKITNYSYLDKEYKDINKLYDRIKNTDPYDIAIEKLFEPKDQIQCIDVDGLPKGFL